MRVIITLIMCVWMLASCQESREEAVLRLVSEWNGKEIKFPSRSVFTIQGKDTVDFEFGHADYKVITYIDSVGCTSCKLQLHRWKQLVAKVDSLTDGRVPFLFYFHPKDMKELRYLTRRDDFTYPVCFDEKDELNQLNQFPSDMTFQTFLLDKDNKVVAMGNPVLNPNIKVLYLDVIMGKTKEKQAGNVTAVSLDRTTMDFGSFPQSEKQERSFILTNTGNGLLVIQDIVTSCGCTKVEYSKEPVRPGETLEVKVIYEAEQAEHFNKTVTVYCNAENSPLRLAVKGAAK
ncbi:MAG: DUF1573 domain-containing protein [Bacteroidaceae bacterium]|nr:DUF1573 domain-containing protein [Bacteroidaceae bacterium]